MTKPLRFVVASDPHGDQVDAETASALFSFIADFRPQIRVHAGDAWDFRNLRRGASDDEIRRAFRKLAKSLHPDVKPDDAGAEARFKAVNAAYSLLSDAENRLKGLAAQAVALLRRSGSASASA